MDKIELVVSKIEDLKEHVDTKLDRYNDLLEVHIKRTDLLEDLHKDNQDRIKKLEKPTVVVGYILGVVGKVGMVAGAIYGVIKLLEVL